MLLFGSYLMLLNLCFVTSQDELCDDILCCSTCCDSAFLGNSSLTQICRQSCGSAEVDCTIHQNVTTEEAACEVGIEFLDPTVGLTRVKGQTGCCVVNNDTADLLFNEVAFDSEVCNPAATTGSPTTLDAPAADESTLILAILISLVAAMFMVVLVCFAGIKKPQKNLFRKHGVRPSDLSSSSNSKDALRITQNPMKFRRKLVKPPKAANSEIRYQGLEAPVLIQTPVKSKEHLETVEAEGGREEDGESMQEEKIVDETAVREDDVLSSRQYRAGNGSTIHPPPMSSAIGVSGSRTSMSSIASNYLDYAMNFSLRLSIFRPSSQYLDKQQNKKKVRRETKKTMELDPLMITDDDL